MNKKKFGESYSEALAYFEGCFFCFLLLRMNRATLTRKGKAGLVHPDALCTGIGQSVLPGVSRAGVSWMRFPMKLRVPDED